MSFKVQKRIFILLRYFLLAGLLTFLSYQFYAHAMGDKLFPSVHGLCPFGGLESLLSFVTVGATLKKIFSGTMVLFFVFLLLALVFNRAFCGLICSFGAIQEFIGNLGRRLFRRRFLVPPSLDRILRYGKYLVLVLTIAMAWLTGTLWFAAYDPWTAYGHLISFDELVTSYWIGLIVLVLSIVGSFFYERFFCKYLCPLGALNAVIGRLSRFSIRRDPQVCIDCSLCTRACPVNLDVEHADTIRSAECISCGKCVAACPREGALNFTFFRRKTGLILAFLLPVVFYFGGIWIAQSFGYDRYSGKTESNLREMADSSGLSVAEFKAMYDLPDGLGYQAKASEVEAVIPLAKMAELNGLDPAAIKEMLGLPADLDDQTPWGDAYGQVTLEKLAELNGASVEELLTAWGLDPDTPPETTWSAVQEQVELYFEAQSGTAGETESCE